jgi:hypothetical protein
MVIRIGRMVMPLVAAMLGGACSDGLFDRARDDDQLRAVRVAR